MVQEIPMIRSGPWKIWFSGECEHRIPGMVELLCQDFTAGENGLAVPGLWKIHGGGRSTVYGVEISGERYCLKVFDDRRLQTRIRTFLGWSKGRRAFRNGLRAREKNVPVPPVYAYAEKTFGPSVLMMKFLENLTQMNLLLEDMLAQGSDLMNDPCFLQMIESFAKFTREMHENGVCHNDFSPRNVLVTRDEERIRLQLIDLEDLVFTRDRRKSRSDIEHFNTKMARYVDSAALGLFLRGFEHFYGEEPNR